MTLLEKASNFAKSAIIFVKAGMPCADEAEIARRLRICSDCPNFDPEGYKNMGKCEVCGCNMEIKTIMATETCPQNRWEESQYD
jgi:hypothetical protein